MNTTELLYRAAVELLDRFDNPTAAEARAFRELQPATHRALASLRAGVHNRDAEVRAMLLESPITHVMRNQSRIQWYRIEIVWNLGDERPFVDRIPALSVKDAKQFALKNYPNAACITITTDGAL